MRSEIIKIFATIIALIFGLIVFNLLPALAGLLLVATILGIFVWIVMGRVYSSASVMRFILWFRGRTVAGLSDANLKDLESLEKVEVLDIDLILPAHGDVIQDSKKGIRRIRDKILEKDEGVLEDLQSGQKTFEELLKIFFPLPTVQFFPGIPILESHLQKLKKEAKIKESVRGTYSLP